MNKTVVYLAASASAELLADIALCPWEAIKVRMQTTLPPYAHNLREGFSKIVAKEGYAGFYKGLYPLWGRQIPYTMVKFATFEKAVEQIYKTFGKPKESYNGLQQTGVSFLGGYIAGVGCAVVSHPAGMFLTLLIEWSLTVCRCDGVEAEQRSEGWRRRGHGNVEDIR
jgi:solute carrier family 25 phosphate transporter 3